MTVAAETGGETGKAPSGESVESIRAILGLPNGTAKGIPSLESLVANGEEEETPASKNSGGSENPNPTPDTYVAPSPYKSSMTKTGREGNDAPGPGTKHELVSASDGASQTMAWRELVKTIGSVESEGHRVGMSVTDLSGNEILSYDPNIPMYPASSIKGPYVMSVWRDNESHSEELLAWTEAVLVWSDNDAYHSMRDTYGDAPLRRIAKEGDLDLTGYDGSPYSWARWYYPATSPADMTKMWSLFAPYLLDGEDDGAAKLRGMMGEREVSPIRDALSPSASTYGKAGWFPEYGDYGATPAMVDAGIVVWPDGRSYVVAIMTDTEEDAESVSRLAACIDRVHYAITHPAEAPAGE